MTTVTIKAGAASLGGELLLPEHAPHGLIVFAHGSGSSQRSPRNRELAEALVDEGFATLLFDLLTDDEQIAERITRNLRFDIPLLTERLIGTIGWVATQPAIASLRIGLFGASTGAAAALVAASKLPAIRAVVSRGGRPDLAGAALRHVSAPTLLIAGGDDIEVVALNRLALAKLAAPAALHIVPQANHLFEEPGALQEVTETAVRWFRSWFAEAPSKAA